MKKWIFTILESLLAAVYIVGSGLVVQQIAEQNISQGLGVAVALIMFAIIHS